MTKDSATLSWKKPFDDGGSKITGYIVEKKSPGNSDWEPVLEVAGKETNVCLKELKENEECQFRIRAKNDIGLSNPSRPTETVKIKDQPEKPSFGVGHVKDITVNAGQNYEIHIPFKANPLPNAIWTVEDRLVVEDERIQIKVI